MAWKRGERARRRNIKQTRKEAKRLAKDGQRLASQRDDLIAKGFDLNELLIPMFPDPDLVGNIESNKKLEKKDRDAAEKMRREHDWDGG